MFISRSSLLMIDFVQYSLILLVCFLNVYYCETIPFIRQTHSREINNRYLHKNQKTLFFLLSKNNFDTFIFFFFNVVYSRQDFIGRLEFSRRFSSIFSSHSHNISIFMLNDFLSDSVSSFRESRCATSQTKNLTFSRIRR